MRDVPLAVADPAVSPANVRTDPRPGAVWRFPAADLVATSASFFTPRPVAAPEWARVYTGWEDSWLETATAQEGPAYWLRIAPGNVQVYRRDQAKAEATRARLADTSAKASLMAAAMELAERETPMVFSGRGDDFGAGEVERRNLVMGWSVKSQRKLVQTIGQLDLAPIVGREQPPALVTLTLPGDWEAVCPDAAAGVAILKRFEKRWLRRWEVQLRCVWKREFQSRGAPHWHLWLSPPAGMDEFAPWLSRTWTECLMIDQSTAYGRREFVNSLAAGTGVDYSRAADARDPQRLATYFLKETLGGEHKAYQNQVPAAWAGQSAGRYWGVKGLAKATVDVPLSTGDGVRVWRQLRRDRASELAPLEIDGERRAGWYARRAVVTARRLLRCRTDHDHTRRCWRVQRRRAVAPPAAGWVTSADGPGLAFRLSLVVGPASPGRFGWPPPGPSLARQLFEARYA